MRLEGWERAPCLLPILRDGHFVAYYEAQELGRLFKRV
jgi:hypothetical protein